MKAIDNYITEKLHLRKGIQSHIDKTARVLEAIHRCLSDGLNYDKDKDYACTSDKSNKIDIDFIFRQDDFSFKATASYLHTRISKDLHKEDIEVITFTTEWHDVRNKKIHIEFE